MTKNASSRTIDLNIAKTWKDFAGGGTIPYLGVVFFNDTATTEIYTLSLHDALPIYGSTSRSRQICFVFSDSAGCDSLCKMAWNGGSVFVLPGAQTRLILQQARPSVQGSRNLQLSVLIDTYNHERLIEAAITSVLEQDFPAFEREVIVVDDGSTDRPSEIVARFEPQVRLIRKKNGGQASAFNVGIPECRGDVIVFLDGDDWWAPGKLRKIAHVFSQDFSLGMVGHAFIESSDDGAQKIIAVGEKIKFQLNNFSAANFFRLSRCYFGTSRLALRAALARKILPVPEALAFEADEFLFTIDRKSTRLNSSHI